MGYRKRKQRGRPEQNKDTEKNKYLRFCLRNKHLLQYIVKYNTANIVAGQHKGKTIMQNATCQQGRDIC